MTSFLLKKAAAAQYWATQSKNAEFESPYMNELFQANKELYDEMKVFLREDLVQRT